MRESIVENDRCAQDFVLSQPDFYSQNRLDEARTKISKFYDSLKGEKKPDFKPFFYTMVAYGRIQEHNPQKSPYICVTDFSKPNTDSRLFIINLNTLQVEEALCVGHGKNSGKGKIPDKFSNKKGSLQSSLGAFKTSEKLQWNTKGTWKGLLLEGMEDSNYRAESRGIFMHPGGVNQSEGCFTIPYEKDKEEVYNVLQKLEGGCLVYSYFDEKSLKDSWIVSPSLRNVLSMGKIGAHNVGTGFKSVASKTKARIEKIFSGNRQKKLSKNHIERKIQKNEHLGNIA